MRTQLPTGRELAALASDVKLSDLPHEVVAAGRLALTDALGVAAAGAVAPGVDALLISLARDAAGDVPVPWTDLELVPGDAALATSALIHGWDFDDTHDSAVVHACSVAVPAALAMGHVEDVDGGRLLEAVVAGIEIACQLGRLLGPAAGVIRTGTCGVFGATAAAGRILDLDPVAMHGALGTALSQAASTRQVVVDGALTKRIQPGFAARAGVLSARLASEGLVGPDGWLDGEFGLLSHAAGGVGHRAIPAAGWEVTRLSLKPYPACRYAHAAVAATEQLAAAGCRPETTARIVVELPKGPEHALVARPWAERGERLVDAQFSVPWLVAAALCDGHVDLATLAGPRLHDPWIALLARRVEVTQPHPQEPSGSLAPVHVICEAIDGTRERVSLAALPGSPESPLSWSHVLAKARTCLEVGGHDPNLAERLGSEVEDLTHSTVRELLRTLAVAPTTTPFCNQSVGTQNSFP